MKLMIDTDMMIVKPVTETVNVTSDLDIFKQKIMKKIQVKTGWGKLQIQQEVEAAYQETKNGM